MARRRRQVPPISPYLPSGKFDLILCRHVLEHVENPLQVLLDLKSLLKSNGELIIVLPIETNLKPVNNEIDFHLFSWTPRTAMNLLKAAKFEDIKWKYNYFTGKRLILPIYNVLGIKYYRSLMKFTTQTVFFICDIFKVFPQQYF